MKSIHSDSFIYIDEHPIGRNQTIPYRVRFEFNRTNLPIILQAQKNNCSLYLSTNNLTNLRYYALLSYSKQRSPLVFVSSYSSHGKTTAIVKSTIFAEGRISQQIRRDVLKNPQLLRHLISSHHWLIFQIFTQLPLSLPQSFKRLLLIIFLLIAVLTFLLIFYFLPPANLLKIGVFIFSLGLLSAIAIFLIKNKLSTWISHQLVEGFFATQFQTRKLGIQLLNLVTKSLE